MVAALRCVVARPRVIAALATLNVGVALVAAQPLAAALAPLLDGRPAATQLLAGPDDGLAAQLLVDHAELVPLAVRSLLLALVAHALLSAVAAGGALAAWGPSQLRGGRALLEAAVRRAGPLVQVGALFLPLRLIAAVAAGGSWLALEPLARGRGFAALALAAALVALLFGALWSLTTVALDYSLALAGDRAAWRTVRDGLLCAWGQPRRTLRLMGFSTGGWLLLGALYHLAAAGLPLLPALSFTLLVLLRLALAGARAAVTAATLVAAASAVTPA